MAITQQNVRWFNNQPYIASGAQGALLGSGAWGSRAISPKMFDAALKNNWLTPLQGFEQQQQAPVQQSMTPQGPQAFQDKLNRLTINASDALYGGLLGYNPKPIVSPTGNTYQPPNPQGGFRFPFGLLNGTGGQ